MKRIISILLALSVICASLVFTTITSNAGSVIESAIAWAEAIASDNSHLYSQSVRWGPSYDCSSFVISAFNAAGVDTGSASWTGNMISEFTQHGFTWIDWSDIGSVSNLQRGDVLLYHNNSNTSTAHTEIYIGNNMNVGAHSSKRPAADQISVSGYYWHPWHGVLRYNENPNFPGEEDTSWVVGKTYYANSRLDTYNPAGVQESGRWIDAGDDCYVEKVFKNGYAWVEYPSGNTRRWAYTLASGFSLEKKQTINNPIGYFDYVTSDNPGEIHLRGWAFDWDNVNADLLIHVYVNDIHYATLKADKSRSDVNAAYPGVGDNHGFDNTIVVNKSGNLNIKVYAINVGSGSNKLVENGEKNVIVNTDPSSPRQIKTCTLDGHEYRLYSCSTTWENAKVICEDKGGYLATITSAREQHMLYKFLAEYSPSNFYLGGTNIIGSWEWVTGEPFSYTAWAKDQPDCANNTEFYLGTLKHNGLDGNLHFWNDFPNNSFDISGFVFESGEIEENIVTPSDNPPTVSYSGYIGDSWTNSAVNGETIGTENNNRFKALRIVLKNCSGGIKYAAHFSGTGWEDYVQDNEVCGSVTNDYSSIEAVKMELYGDVASNYNLFYRAYVRDKGWFGWAKNGEVAGSTGGALPITAIQIVLVPQVKYSVHVQDKGWMESVKNGEACGTTGEKLRIEAIRIGLADTSYGNIRYNTHLSDIGWGTAVYNGKESGSTSLGIQMEAFAVDLDGQAKELYDVIYSAHVQDKGWLDWVRTGSVAGTTGEVLRMEAIKVMIVPKGYDEKSSYNEYSTEPFTVSFDAMGGECNVKSKQVDYCGFFMDLPTPTKENLVFDGWYDSVDYDNKITSSSVLETKSNITLYARWKEKVILGDTNGDGDVDSVDATIIQRVCTMIKVPFTEEQLMCGDVDGDGSLTTVDATFIQRYATHVKTPYNIGEPI